MKYSENFKNILTKLNVNYAECNFDCFYSHIKILNRWKTPGLILTSHYITCGHIVQVGIAKINIIYIYCINTQELVVLVDLLIYNIRWGSERPILKTSFFDNDKNVHKLLLVLDAI